MEPLQHLSTLTASQQLLRTVMECPTSRLTATASPVLVIPSSVSHLRPLSITRKSLVHQSTRTWYEAKLIQAIYLNSTRQNVTSGCKCLQFSKQLSPHLPCHIARHFHVSKTIFARNPLRISFSLSTRRLRNVFFLIFKRNFFSFFAR